MLSRARLRFSTCLGIAWYTFGFLGVSHVAYAGDAPGKEKHEEMHKKHEECLKKSGAFDQQQLDTLSECHKANMQDAKSKEGKDSWKEAVQACLKEKGLTLSKAQEDAMQGCHHRHSK